MCKLGILVYLRGVLECPYHSDFPNIHSLGMWIAVPNRDCRENLIYQISPITQSSFTLKFAMSVASLSKNRRKIPAQKSATAATICVPPSF